MPEPKLEAQVFKKLFPFCKTSGKKDIKGCLLACFILHVSTCLFVLFLLEFLRGIFTQHATAKLSEYLPENNLSFKLKKKIARQDLKSGTN